LREAKDYVDAVERSESPPPSSPAVSELVSDDEIRDLIREGSYVHAIKRVRETTGRGLKEAKEYVDEISRAMRSLSTAQEPVSDQEILSLVQRGSYVQAIKRVREATRWGLREAKDYVDEVAGREGLSRPPPGESRPDSTGRPGPSLFARLFRGRIEDR
jgi:ribosomal protein L7/L12